MASRIRCARRHQVQRLTVTHEARQEVAAGGLRDEAPARKDKANLCLRPAHADSHRQRHGDADAHCGALDSANGRLAAVVDGEGDAAAAVAVRLLRLGGTVLAAVELEALCEVGAGAEHASVPGHDDGLDAVVDAEQGEDLLDFAAHAVGEGIVVLRPVERDNDDWCWCR